MSAARQVAIAGATGFVGRELLREFTAGSIDPATQVVALTRGTPRADASGQVQWRRTDFFSVHDLAASLAGVETAVYLIHSMMPTARLDQSRFEDTDLWLADTFGRAAALAGVRHIIYLGAIAPVTAATSTHLRSRKEVETALSSGGVQVTTLRAGMILGADSASFQILFLLVKRLPVMLCPRWAWTRTQPVSIADVTGLLRYSIAHPQPTNVAFDIACPDVTSYRELMLECARQLGAHRPMLQAPFFSPKLSTLWVSLITGASGELVAPLVRSLAHPMLARDNPLLAGYRRALGRDLESSSAALARCLPLAAPVLRLERQKRSADRGGEPLARSIQRFARPPGAGPLEIAADYFHWLHRWLAPVIAVEVSGSGSGSTSGSALDRATFKLLGRFALLSLQRLAQEEEPERVVFQVDGGLLARTTAGPRGSGQLEFRLCLGGTAMLVGLHDFAPRLPWAVYKYTQAVAHLLIMKAFGVRLARQAARSDPK